MNDNLAKIVKAYSLLSHEEYAQKMHDFSKDTVIGTFTDLLTMYINDKNSSTLREFITVSLAGYDHCDSKIGFNGYKHSSPTTSVACEAKPKNVSRDEYEEHKAGKRKTFRKLNGGGNFTDYTWERYERDKAENLNMLVSGFIDGRLIYILEFPFAEEAFTTRLEIQLQNHFPNGDETGRFLRSANFDYRHFIESENLKVIYGDVDTIKEAKPFMVAGFYDKLLTCLTNP